MNDAINGSAVLLGGYAGNGYPSDTWIWWGGAWTHGEHGPGRYDATMAYDAPHDEVVLFGGFYHHFLADTWTWDGTNWTLRHPAHSPPARDLAAMAYDSDSERVILFGGWDGQLLGDTWTWSGTDWRRLSPAHAPAPRFAMSMSDGGATHAPVILFGGWNANHVLGDTWTWNGTDWRKLAPVNHPPARARTVLAISHAGLTLFGGYDGQRDLGDTWVWNGVNWAEFHPAHSPIARSASSGVYDSGRGQFVLFGGRAGSSYLGDTWTFDGIDWTLPSEASIGVDRPWGEPGDRILVHGWGFDADERVRILFVDSTLGAVRLKKVIADGTGGWYAIVRIPSGATLGRQYLKARGKTSEDYGKQAFTIR